MNFLNALRTMTDIQWTTLKSSLKTNNLITNNNSHYDQLDNEQHR